jgi:hypothetical protein
MGALQVRWLGGGSAELPRGVRDALDEAWLGETLRLQVRVGGTRWAMVGERCAMVTTSQPFFAWRGMGRCGRVWTVRLARAGGAGRARTFQEQRLEERDVRAVARAVDAYFLRQRYCALFFDRAFTAPALLDAVRRAGDSIETKRHVVVFRPALTRAPPGAFLTPVDVWLYRLADAASVRCAEPERRRAWVRLCGGNGGRGSRGGRGGPLRLEAVFDHPLMLAMWDLVPEGRLTGTADVRVGGLLVAGSAKLDIVSLRRVMLPDSVVFGSPSFSDGEYHGDIARVNGFSFEFRALGSYSPFNHEYSLFLAFLRAYCVAHMAAARLARWWRAVICNPNLRRGREMVQSRLFDGLSPP